jgi:hypothetical protein
LRNTRHEAAQEGPGAFLTLMSVVSLNLAIFNLLPIPILDGAMILTLLIEMVMGRDISLNVKESMLKVGFVFLMMLMVSLFRPAGQRHRPAVLSGGLGDYAESDVQQEGEHGQSDGEVKLHVRHDHYRGDMRARSHAVGRAILPADTLQRVPSRLKGRLQPKLAAPHASP